MQYLVNTKNRGPVLAPDTVWIGNRKFKLRIHGRSDSDYVANTDDRRSVSGEGRVFINGAPVIFRSATQKFVTLSLTEAEHAAGVMFSHDILYMYHLLLSLGLAVKLPMLQVFNWR